MAFKLSLKLLSEPQVNKYTSKFDPKVHCLKIQFYKYIITLIVVTDLKV